MTNKQAYAGLLPCPFCGGTDLKIEAACFVRCRTCTCEGPVMDASYDSDEEMIRATAEQWNTRPEAAEAISSLLKRVGELEGALAAFVRIVEFDALLQLDPELDEAAEKADALLHAALNSDAPPLQDQGKI